MSTEDPSLIAKGLQYAAGAALALAGLVWNDNKRRVAMVEKSLEEKADKEEVDRQRDNIGKLFDGQTEIRAEMNEGFNALANQLHSMHVELLNKIK